MKQAIGIVAAAVLAILGLTWLAQGNDFFIYRYFAPKYEQTRRQVFEQTRSFNQGMVQELENMQFEYAKAGAKEKDALASVILHRAAGYNLNDPAVPADLREFIERLRRERTE